MPLSHEARQLRNQQMRGDAQLGMSVAEISAAYGIGASRVTQILYGECSKPRKDSERIQKRWSMILPLFEKGLAAKEIAKRIGASFATVTSDLVRHLGSARQPKLPNPQKKPERDRQIAALAADPGSTLESIAAEFQITRERVRQIINRLIREGALSESPAQQRAAMIRISRLGYKSRELIAEGVIHPVAAGKRMKYIPPEEFVAGQTLIEARHPRCEKCGNKISMGVRCGRCRDDDPAWRAADNKRRWKKLESGAVKHTSPLHSEIKKIRRDKTCRIFRAEAQRLARLTDMQFNYLSAAHLFSRQSKNPRVPNGKGAKFLYSESEMRQIGQIVERLRSKKNGRRSA